jgi:hypothetical protein
MLIPQTVMLKLSAIAAFKHLLEDVLEAPIILLEDRVLC